MVAVTFNSKYYENIQLILTFSRNYCKEFTVKQLQCLAYILAWIVDQLVLLL